MKKMTIVTALLSASILGGIAVQTASAADISNTTTSTGKVSFSEDTDPTTPVDPTDPTKPVKPTDPTKPTAGPLSIDFVPNLDFGSHKIASTNKTYFAAAQKVADTDGTSNLREVSNYAQVTDKRSADNRDGWKLSVKQEAQFGNDTDSLNGAVIAFDNLGKTAIADVNVVGNNDVTVNKDSVGTTLTLTPESEVTVMSATENNGFGTWIATTPGSGVTAKTDADGTYTNDKLDNNVSLTVPATSGAKAIDYTTTLTWKISNTPS